ncbi:hypothetical protein L202_00709 [Cryptococcus amylolentus CBS 6039]|uniref:Uncharacterized protein n=1 Tax=Cryptococcus amylolentus CBS 6039 TaxID=1295533 RepID=A0A1E3IAR3_9TREE|nr:hypothetical protein L202_00709 [Cryptococcus amylolentus CBS 6039]ODN84851.1 hypothetical protein L202_00709 [Cryptococcus amylolentus CBS 6039]
MLALRYSRRSAIRIARNAPRIQQELPHAESSSAPSRRQFSVTAPQNQPQPSPIAQGPKRRRGGKNELIENARKLAAALKAEDSAATIKPEQQQEEKPAKASEADAESGFWDGLLNPSPSSEFPMSTGEKPTLEDLLSKRPERDPPAPWRTRYPLLYKRLYNSIDQAFVVKQLRVLAPELKIGYISKSISKSQLIVKIMDSWGWVEPREAPKPPTTYNEVFDLPPAELFLFLQDQALLEQLATDAGLHLSVVRASQAPASHFHPLKEGDGDRMVLVARGIDEDLALVKQALEKRRESIIDITFSQQEVFGVKAPVILLRAVSNVAGAYVEVVGDQYRITALTSAIAQKAKQLLHMSIFRTGQMNQSQPTSYALSPPPQADPTLSETPRPTSEQRYALYPFLPCTTEQLPWDIAFSTADKTFFRLGQVKKWQDKPSARSVAHRQENMELRPSLIAGEGEVVFGESVREWGRDGKVSARVGHLVLPVEPADGRTGTWDSPLPGQWPLEMLTKWSSEARGKAIEFIFTPSLSPVTTQYPLPGQPTLSRRLRYHSASEFSKVVVFTNTEEYGAGKVRWQEKFAQLVDELERSAESAEEVESAVTEQESTVEDVIRELGVAEGEGPLFKREAQESPEEHVEGDQAVDVVDNVEVEELETKATTSNVLTAEYGTIKENNVFLPDRPVDVKLTSTSLRPLLSIPDEITSFFSSTHFSAVNGATPPSSVDVEGERFDLAWDETVRETRWKKEGVVVKSVEVEEELGRGVVYSEIENEVEGELSEAFWAELADITQDIGPDAAALN